MVATLGLAATHSSHFHYVIAICPTSYIVVNSQLIGRAGAVCCVRTYGHMAVGRADDDHRSKQINMGISQQQLVVS